VIGYEADISSTYGRRDALAPEQRCHERYNVTGGKRSSVPGDLSAIVTWTRPCKLWVRPCRPRSALPHAEASPVTLPPAPPPAPPAVPGWRRLDTPQRCQGQQLESGEGDRRGYRHSV
jgi:hypothetical protein